MRRSNTAPPHSPAPRTAQGTKLNKMSIYFVYLYYSIPCGGRQRIFLPRACAPRGRAVNGGNPSPSSSGTGQKRNTNKQNNYFVKFCPTGDCAGGWRRGGAGACVLLVARIVRWPPRCSAPPGGLAWSAKETGAGGRKPGKPFEPTSTPFTEDSGIVHLGRRRCQVGLNKKINRPPAE